MTERQVEVGVRMTTVPQDVQPSLRQAAISWLLSERAKMQAVVDRLDAELAAVITADAEPNEKEIRHERFH